MSFRLKYIKYKKKYNELKGGTIENPGETIIFGMKIRHYYNKSKTSNNISIEEYNFITKLNNQEYVNKIYGIEINKDIVKKILNKFNLFYKKLYLRGVGIENYPYGVYQLKNYISLSNDFIFLKNREIIKKNLLYTFTNKNLNFIEVIRFEKDEKDNWTLQDTKSESIHDPGYMLKGVFYYPCIGSGIFLHYKQIKYYFNKLDAISKMHELWKNQYKSPPPPTPRNVDDSAPSSLEGATPRTPLPLQFKKVISIEGEIYSTSEKHSIRIKQQINNFSQIDKKNIIKDFILKNNFGRFDPSKNIFLSNLDYICNKVKKFNYLNKVGYLEYLFKNFNNNDEKIKDKIYDLYYDIFSCELTFNKLLNYIKDFDDKSKIFEALEKLNNWANDKDKSLEQLLNDKEILDLFINRQEYLNILIKRIKDDPSLFIEEDDANILVNNILIEIYSQVYTANFNQLFIDSTLYYYAKQLNIDTVVLLCEPLDKYQHFGTEIISIEDYQSDSFVRTINCGKLMKLKSPEDDEFKKNLICYLSQIVE